MFNHVEIDLLLPSIQKDVQERILLKATSFLHEREDGDFAQPYSHTVPQKALNAKLGHEQLIILTGRIIMSFNSDDSFWAAICSQRYMQCVDSRFLFATFFYFCGCTQMITSHAGSSINTQPYTFFSIQALILLLVKENNNYC